MPANQGQAESCGWYFWGLKEGKVEGRPLTDTNRRQEGEKVVLLVVNDIPGVPLLPLLWVAEPHSSGTEVAHAAASRPRAAPDGRNPD